MTSPNAHGNWPRKHFWALAMLIALLIVSSLAVKHFRRPGQMTIIESQAMDMSAMKPPVGSVPVATEVVTCGSFNATVRYSGTVAPMNDQNIFPRIQGRLTGLNVYNGDRVRSGQLLAVLDSPDVQDKLSEATYGHIAALKEIPISQANVEQMRAERTAAAHQVLAAISDVQGARAHVKAAQRMVDQSQDDLKSANASLKYWKAEILREGNLLKAGAVSQQEFDSEQSQATTAEADVTNEQSAVEEARANVDAARADLTSKEAQVRIARDQAAAAEAALKAASGEVSQKSAMANMAGAAQSTAASFAEYLQIRAPFDGVVTQRYLSPGVVVNPGMAILNIAQIDKVRLQANVAEQDAGNIRVGAAVIAHNLKEPEKTIRAFVTSISPAADPTSRTSIVEAIVDNPDHSLVPGDFVSLDITTSSSSTAITVPSSALVTKENGDAVWIALATKGGPVVYTCPMHPQVISNQPGKCPICGMPLVKKQAETGRVAHLAYVTIGKTAGDRTEIISGLNPGDEVIYQGNGYLREGDAVTSTKWGSTGPTELPTPPGGSENMNMPGM